jgi:hypothetical protein
MRPIEESDHGVWPPPCLLLKKDDVPEITVISIGERSCVLETLVLPDLFIQIAAYLHDLQTEVFTIAKAIAASLDGFNGVINPFCEFARHTRTKYSFYDFRDQLHAFVLTQSISRSGNCWDEAPRERCLTN